MVEFTGNPNLKIHTFDEGSKLKTIRFSTAPEAKYIRITYDSTNPSSAKASTIKKAIKASCSENIQPGDTGSLETPAMGTAYIGEVSILTVDPKQNASDIIGPVLMALKDANIISQTEMEEAAFGTFELSREKLHVKFTAKGSHKLPPRN